MVEQNDDLLRQSVRDCYGSIAHTGGSCCSGDCCGTVPDLAGHVEKLGYSSDEASALPEGARVTLGCGNPHAIANLREGEMVLDFGSGGGLDCFLVSQRVGPAGRVIGVDMTPEMVQKARTSARQGGYTNVESRLGEIERLPVADCSVDVILSNCVINLSPDKEAVFFEAFRVLKPGGRLSISDIVAVRELLSWARTDSDVYCGCAGGAALVTDIESILCDAGFENIRIGVKRESAQLITSWFPGSSFKQYVRSVLISVVKPYA